MLPPGTAIVLAAHTIAAKLAIGIGDLTLAELVKSTP